MELQLLDTDLKFFEIQGRNYVLDIPSSTLFEIHPNLKRILGMSVHNTTTAYLNELKREYHLMDWMEMLGELKYMVDYRHLTIHSSKIRPYELKEQKINSIMLNVCHECNMHCGYCYQNVGDFRKDVQFMQRDVALRSIEFLFKESPDSRVLLNISGGEPLLCVELIKYIIRTAREHEEKYEKELIMTLITNGTLLTKEILHDLTDARVKLIITLGEGAIEENQHRVFTNQHSSFELIYERLEWVKESGINYLVKGMVHHFNLPKLEETLDFYAEKEYKQILLEPVVAPPEESFAFTDEDIVLFKKCIMNLYSRYQGQDIFTQKVSNLTTAVNCIAGRKNLGYSCGAGKNYLCIAPNGDIFPCHLLVGKKEFLLGNILLETFNHELRKQFYQPLHVLNREDCKTCWARYFCGGGCVGENYLIYQNLIKPNQVRCELTCYGMEKAIEVYCSSLHNEDKLDIYTERRKSAREVYKVG